MTDLNLIFWIGIHYYWLRPSIFSATIMSTNGSNNQNLNSTAAPPLSSNGALNGGPLPNGGQQQQPSVGGSSVQPIQPAPPIADLMSSLEEYTPTIPDAVTMHFLSTAGFQTDDPRIVKLVSLAAQKFVSDIANDALQHCKLRGAGQVRTHFKFCSWLQKMNIFLPLSHNL